MMFPLHTRGEWEYFTAFSGDAIIRSVEVHHPLALAIQGPFHSDRSGSTAVGLLTPQHPSIPLPVHVDHRHIHITVC
jgi:hypothetical protein